MKRYIMLFTIIGTIFALDGNKDKEAMTGLIIIIGCVYQMNKN